MQVFKNTASFCITCIGAGIALAKSRRLTNRGFLRRRLSIVPEPASMTLVATGLAAISCFIRQKLVR